MIKAAGVCFLLLTLALPGSVTEASPVKKQALKPPARAVHQHVMPTARLISETPESTHSAGREIDQSELRHLHPFVHDVVLIDVGHGGIDGGTSYGDILEKISIWPFHADCSCCSARKAIMPC